MDAVTAWTRFTLRHPWFSATIVAIAGGTILGLVIDPAAGLGFGLIFLFVMGIGQSIQSDRATEEEKAQGRVVERPGWFGKWIRAHPWLFGAINGLVLAVWTLIQEIDEADTREVLLLSLLSGGALFFISVLAALVARRRAR